MGQFSWFTQDDGQQILDDRDDKVYMTDDMGNRWLETHYEGYGVFGGKDYYELLAEMNGYSEDDFKDKGDPKEALRQKGIDLAFGTDEEHPNGQYPYGDNPNVKHPSLSHSGKYFGGVAPEPDPNQGWEMYDDDPDDDWDDDY